MKRGAGHGFAPFFVSDPAAREASARVGAGG